MEPESQPSRATGPTHPLNVLVADDEPLVRAALKRLLERRGHQVHEAGDAAEALALLERHAFDAVLVDRRMPGEGLSVLRRLEERQFPGLVILMSGELAPEAQDLGRHVVRLQKPFRFPSVVSLVEGQISP